MYIRKIVSLVLAICVFTSMIMVVNVESSSTTQQKAVILNQLNIISGDGKGNYDLKGQLKRREAATFITKVMGKADYVTNNASEFKYTNFTDVKPNDWFAPYVGFCEQNSIVSGYTDGRFGHDDPISEKAFLTMLIRAMGYSTDTDFTYNGVYQFAYELGLLEGEGYLEKTEDNRSYVRGGVVEVLYRAMTNNIKGQDFTLIQKLVRDGAIAKSTALSSGMLDDDVITSISNITPNNELKVTVELNEAVKALSNTNFSVYESNNKGNKLTVTLVSQSDREIVLKTSQQRPEVNYTLEISSTEDLKNNINDTLLAKFTGYKSTEIKSDFFKISKVEVMSKNNINVYFTHPINVNSEQPSYYEIFENGATFASGAAQNITTKLISSVDNGISINLKDKNFTEGLEYTLKISGELTSVYTVRLGLNSGDAITFVGKANENQELALVSSMALNSRTLQLIFNKDLNPNLADKKLNYIITIDDANKTPITVSGVEISTDGIYQGRCVNITLSSYLDKTKIYNLKIDYLTDLNRQYSIIDKDYKFSGSYQDGSNIKVQGVVPIDAGTVVISFDKPVNEQSAAIPSNFFITGVTDANYFAIPLVTYFNKETPNLVKLFLSGDQLLQVGKVYKLKVQISLVDGAGNNLTTPIESTFASPNVTTAKPRINKAVLISDDTVKVTFTKEIKLDVNNILPSNYILEYTQGDNKYTKVPLAVNYIDAATISLKFDKLDLSTAYRIRFKSLTDYSGVNITTEKDTDTSAAVVMGQ